MGDVTRLHYTLPSGQRAAPSGSFEEWQQQGELQPAHQPALRGMGRWVGALRGMGRSG